MVSVLRDTEALNHFFDDSFDGFLSRIPSCGQKAKEPEGWWRGLSEAEKQELSAQHPSFPFLFTESESQLEQWEESLLEDCPVDEFVNSLRIDFATRAKLLAFVHCLGSIEVSSLVGGSDQEQALVAFLSHFTSGVKLSPEKSHSVRDLFLLPQVIKSIVDQQAAVDARVKDSGTGLLGRMFGPRRTTLKDYERVYVFVFGGISFAELKEIRRICANGNMNISIKVISDTICASMSILPTFSE
jgi:hypothetical protein